MINDVVDPDTVSLSFPCLRATQPIGDFFVATIPYEKLRKFTFFDVRRTLQEQRDVEKYLGIQRPVDNKRIKDLSKYVNLVDASFPSSIIVSLEEDYVDFDEDSKELTIRNFRRDESAPSTAIAKIGRVIDGQHRIAGLEFFHPTVENEKFDLTVTIFIGADIADQAHIFATVNIEQTKVNKSLVYDLYELSRSRSPQKTCHNIVVALDRDREGPFYRRIKRLGIAREDVIFQPVTQATIVESLIGYLSEDPKIDRDNLIRGKSLNKLSGDELFKRPFRNMFVDGKDLEIIQVVHNFFSAVRDRWPVAWDERGQGHVLNRTLGVRALLRFLRRAYAQSGVPGDVVSQKKFFEIFQRIDLNDADFTIDNFVPGTGGEAKLYRILDGKEVLGR